VDTMQPSRAQTWNLGSPSPISPMVECWRGMRPAKRYSWRGMAQNGSPSVPSAATTAVPSQKA
jgi:hypothetical protein